MKLPSGLTVLVGNWSVDNAFQLMMKTHAVTSCCRYSQCRFVLLLKLVPLCRAYEKCFFKSYFLANRYSISISHTPLLKTHIHFLEVRFFLKYKYVKLNSQLPFLLKQQKQTSSVRKPITKTNLHINFINQAAHLIQKEFVE